MTSKSPVRSCEDIDETALSYAEIKALCAGDPRIREKMDLDVEVAKLRLLKASHQSQQYRLEDNLLKFFPEQIELNKNIIAGMQADMEMLAAHPHPKDGFAGMIIKEQVLPDKEKAGVALMNACKEFKGFEQKKLGSYRGFTTFLSVENFGHDFVMTLKGQLSHRATLGSDVRGNLIRIDNALSNMPEKLQDARVKLDNLYKQVKEAKAEHGKPFPQERELQQKAARLAELNVQLNIERKGNNTDSEPEQAPINPLRMDDQKPAWNSEAIEELDDEELEQERHTGRHR